MGLSKDEERKAELDSVMVHLAESLRIVAILLQPIMTQTPKRIFEQLGLNVDMMNLENIHFGEFPENTKVTPKGKPIFPRLDMEEEVAYIKEKMSEGSKPEEEKIKWDPEETELVSVKDKEIKFDVFDKVELKVAEVMECKKSKAPTSCYSSVWTQETNKTAKFYRELLNITQIQRAWSARN